jgi:hypothetical protein
MSARRKPEDQQEEETGEQAYKRKSGAQEHGGRAKRVNRKSMPGSERR